MAFGSTRVVVYGGGLRSKSFEKPRNLAVKHLQLILWCLFPGVCHLEVGCIHFFPPLNDDFLVGRQPVTAWCTPCSNEQPCEETWVAGHSVADDDNP